MTLLADDRRRARIHVREILKSAFLYSWNARGETRSITVKARADLGKNVERKITLPAFNFPKITAI